MCTFLVCNKIRKFNAVNQFFLWILLYRIGIMLKFASAIVPNNLIQFIMSNLVFNPQSKDYYQAKACVAISLRYNYAGSYRSYRFKFLSFRNWSSSYRAAFCYVLKRLEEAVIKDEYQILTFTNFCDLFIIGESFDFYHFLEQRFRPYFSFYFNFCSSSQKLSFVYKLLECLVMYNLGDVRYDLVSSMFEEKSAIRYAASKYFPDTRFIEIESDFMFKDVMD